MPKTDELVLPGHGRYDYSAIDHRPDYSWPGGKRLAFYIGINIEHFAFGAGNGMDPFNRTAPVQTQRNFSWRDYGNRVGNWRLFGVLEELKLPASVLLNGLCCTHYPELIAKIKARGDEIVGHGRTNAETLRGLWENDERRMIADSTAMLAQHFGKPPAGWMGPGAVESPLTPDLLKEAGYTYVLDWPADDQPFWLRTRSGPLLNVPYPMELNDAGAQSQRDQTGRDFADMIVDQFEEQVADSEKRAQVYALALHGFIIGQPYRIQALRKALKHCREHKHADRVWWCRSGDIAEHCFELAPGIVPGSKK